MNTGREKLMIDNDKFEQEINELTDLLYLYEDSREDAYSTTTYQDIINLINALQHSDELSNKELKLLQKSVAQEIKTLRAEFNQSSNVEPLKVTSNTVKTSVSEIAYANEEKKAFRENNTSKNSSEDIKEELKLQKQKLIDLLYIYEDSYEDSYNTNVYQRLINLINSIDDIGDISKKELQLYKETLSDELTSIRKEMKNAEKANIEDEEMRELINE